MLDQYHTTYFATRLDENRIRPSTPQHSKFLGLRIYGMTALKLSLDYVKIKVWSVKNFFLSE